MHNFDLEIMRKGSDCVKWDRYDNMYKVPDLIEMGCADADFKCPQEILDALTKVIEHGVLGYCELSPLFYDNIISWYKTRHNLDIKKEEIVFCPRINVSCGLCIEAFSQEGDEILINSPLYPPLKQAIVLNKRIAKEIPLKREGNKFYFDFEALEKSITNKTRIFVLVSPHNPTTRVWSEEELSKIAELCVKHNLILYVDEIHSDLIRKHIKFTSSLALKGPIEDLLIMTHSVAKTFNVPGVVSSYLIIKNKELRDKVNREIVRVGIDNINVFANAVMKVAYSQCAYFVDEFNDYIENNEKFFISEIKKIFPDVDIIEREGSFLLFVSFNKIAKEDEMFDFFLNKAHVVPHQGSYFGKGFDGYFRFNLATPKATLQEVINRLKKAKESL